MRRFAHLAAGLGVHFDVGSSDGERMLDLQKAEAAVFVGEGESTVILRANATASAVLEELAHALQAHRAGSWGFLMTK